MMKNGLNLPTAKGQAGFTMIEVSIGLVVIGLLMAGIMKGSEFVRSAKDKSLIGQIDSLKAAINLSQEKSDRLSGLPGDGRFWYFGEDGSITLQHGNQNGAIDTGEDQSALLWLRNMELISGGREQIGYIDNPFGGDTFVRSNFTQSNGGLEVCSTKVPLKTISAIKSKVDDSSPMSVNFASGSVRARLMPDVESAYQLNPDQDSVPAAGDAYTDKLGYMCISI